MGSTIIPIPDGDWDNLEEKRKFQFSCFPTVSFLEENKPLVRKWIHSIKVGVALVVVSLLYFLDPFYDEIGDNNAMWAIMTVVVMFEFYAGATISKGLNRGLGTILGAGLGCLAAILAHKIGGIGQPITIGIALFVFGGAATYLRLIPKIKRTYDYGSMIFILTFNLVSVSGFREGNVVQIARERLLMILIGFGVCICTSLFLFPIWASDELHDSAVSKFKDLASSIEGCLEEYFSEKENQRAEVQPEARLEKCKSVLQSKAKDEFLANFARWEPWHGRFGLWYPWEKYQKIGEVLRELASTILSLEGSIRSPEERLQHLRESIKEPCEAAGSTLAWTLRELGESIKKMRRCQSDASIVPNLKSAREELYGVMCPAKLVKLEDPEGVAMASFVFTLTVIVEKVERLVKETEELGQLGRFLQS